MKIFILTVTRDDLHHVQVTYWTSFELAEKLANDLSHDSLVFNDIPLSNNKNAYSKGFCYTISEVEVWSELIT